MQSPSKASESGKRHSAEADQNGRVAGQIASPVVLLSGSRRSKRRTTMRNFTKDANVKFVSSPKEVSAKPKPEARKSSLEKSESKIAGSGSAAKTNDVRRTALDFSGVKVFCPKEDPAAKTPTKLTPAAQQSQMQMRSGDIVDSSGQKLRTAEELHQPDLPQLPSSARSTQRTGVDRLERAGCSNQKERASTARDESVNAVSLVQDSKVQKLESKLADIKAAPTIKAEPQVMPL